MQIFYIKQNSTNPELRMELVNNGRYNFNKFYDAIQDSVISFSMKNMDNGIIKISNAKADIIPANDCGCDEKYIISYKWKERDTKEKGKFIAHFNIKFNGNISENGTIFPTGNLIVPIQEELIIYII